MSTTDTDRSAGDAVLAATRATLAELAERMPHVAEDPVPQVHAIRISLRRLRAALAAFTEVVDATAADHLHSELAWLAGELGPVRDADVVRRGLAARLAEVGVGPLAETAARLRDQLEGTVLRDVPRAVAAAGSARYAGLAAELTAFIDAPPFTADAARPLGQMRGQVVLAQVSRVHRRAGRALAADRGPVRDERLHDLRKAGRRTRYVCELVDPDGAELGPVHTEVLALQTALGTYQDALVARRTLAQLIPPPGAEQQHDQLVSRLDDLERRRGERAFAELPGLLARLDLATHDLRLR